MTSAEPVVVYLTATPPWPTTNGGRLRSALTLEALGMIGPTHLLVAPPMAADVSPPSHVRSASVTVARVPLPGNVTRVRQRSTAAILARHPYVVRWEAAGGPIALRGVVDRVGATIVILEFPFYPTAAAALLSSGAAIVADVADDRIATARAAMRSASPSVRLGTLLDHRALRRSERRLTGIDQAWYAAPADALSARHRHRGLDIRVVPNAVDTRRLAAVSANALPAIPHSAAFLGSFDYLPNDQAAHRFASGIAPRLRSADGEPAAHLALIGRRPSSALRDAAEADGVEVHGDVADAAVTLSGYQVLVVPLRSGSGTKLKILEALGLGIPVVTTSVGLAGLDLIPGVHVLVAETDEGLAGEVRRLWADPDLRASLGSAGRTVVQARYGIDAVRDAVAEALVALRRP